DINEDLKNHLVSDNYREALKQEKIDLVAVLDLQGAETLTPGQPFSFKVVLDVPPEFELPAYQGISLQGNKVEVTDQMVEEAMNDLRERAARFEDVSGRPAQRGDLVQVDYEGACDGTPVEQIAPGARGLGQGKDFWASADEHAFLEGFGEALIGAGVGEKKEILINFKADFYVKELAGKKAAYKVEVKGLREKKLPDMDETFCKMFGEESLTSLKERVRKDIQSAKEEQEKSRLKGEIAKFLLAETRMDVPESEVQEETRNTVYDMVRYNTNHGIPRDQIEEKRGEIFEAASRSAMEKTKLRYILHRIAEKENIVSTEEDLAAEMRAFAARYGVEEGAFRAEMEKRDAIDKMREDIRLRKSSDFLLERAKVKV
ncbi:MAG: trigger factor, partial [Lentisphaerota bacterium]